MLDRSWLMLKYPILKEKRIHLIRIYFHLAILPGMPTHIVATVSDGLHVLTRSKKKLTIEDLRLPWKPIFDILDNDLFLSRRQFEIRYVTPPPCKRARIKIYMVQPNIVVHGLHCRQCPEVLSPCRNRRNVIYIRPTGEWDRIECASTSTHIPRKHPP